MAPSRLALSSAKSLTPIFSATGLNQRNDFVATVSLRSSKHEQLFNARQHCTALWRANNTNPTASREIEQPLVTKNVQGTNHGVLVHAENGCQVDRWRKSFTLSRFTLGDGPSDLRGNLVVESNRLSLVYF
jgi:hypothetical protein